jgi:protein-tyrosine-phosphatase
MGVNLTDHRSMQVTGDMIEDSEIVFTMEYRQAVILRKTFPAHVSKIFLLSLFDADPLPAGDHVLRYNIPDPYGKSEEDFLECFRKIERSIEGFLFRSDLQRER